MATGAVLAGGFQPSFDRAPLNSAAGSALAPGSARADSGPRTGENDPVARVLNQVLDGGRSLPAGAGGDATAGPGQPAATQQPNPASSPRPSPRPERPLVEPAELTTPARTRMWAGVVRLGAQCETALAQGMTEMLLPVVCSPSPDGRLRWIAHS